MTTTALPQSLLSLDSNDPGAPLEQIRKGSIESSGHLGAPELQEAFRPPSAQVSSVDLESLRAPRSPISSSSDDTSSVCSNSTSFHSVRKLEESESDFEDGVGIAAADSHIEADAPTKKRSGKELWGIVRSNLERIVPKNIDPADSSNKADAQPKPAGQALADIVKQAVIAATKRQTAQQIKSSNANLMQIDRIISTKSARFEQLNSQLVTALKSGHRRNSRNLRNIIRSLETLNQEVSGLADSCNTQHNRIKELKETINHARGAKTFTGNTTLKEVEKDGEMLTKLASADFLEDTWNTKSLTTDTLKNNIGTAITSAKGGLHQYKIDKYLGHEKTLSNRISQISQKYNNMEINSSRGRDSAIKNLKKEVRQLKKEIDKLIRKVDQLPANTSSNIEENGSMVSITANQLKEALQFRRDISLPQLQEPTRTLIEGKYQSAKMSKYQGMFQSLHKKHSEALDKQEQAFKQIDIDVIENHASKIKSELAQLEKFTILVPIRKNMIHKLKPMSQFKGEIKLLKKIDKAHTDAEKAQRKLDALFEKKVAKLKLTDLSEEHTTLTAWKTVTRENQLRAAIIVVAHSRLSTPLTELKTQVNEFLNYDFRSDRSSAADDSESVGGSSSISRLSSVTESEYIYSPLAVDADLEVSPPAPPSTPAPSTADLTEERLAAFNAAAFSPLNSSERPEEVMSEGGNIRPVPASLPLQRHNSI